MNQSRSSFRHDEITMPFTHTRQTDIRMPILDDETIYTALFILENNVPVTMINEVLEQAHEKTEIHNIWMADHDSLEGLIEEDEQATVPPIEESWQSPFVGYTIEQAFEYLATIPLEKSLNREFIIVWNQALYERKQWMVICRIDRGGEITSIPCLAHMCMIFVDSGTEHRWSEYLEEWRKHGKPIF